MRCRDSRSA